MNDEQFLSHFEGVKRSGDGWVARCGGHDDRHASLSIGISERSGRRLIRCHAGCDSADVVRAAGLSWADLFPEGKKSARREIEAIYRYEDEHGERLFECVRYSTGGPRFHQRQHLPGHVDADREGFVWSLGREASNGRAAVPDVRRVLFRTPQVLAAVAEGQTVWVVEGEKDVESLERAGVVATTNPMGAGRGKWRPEFSETLRGADVVIVRDKDEAGRKHGAEVAASLEGVARSVRVVEAAAGKDAADHLQAGHSVDEFVEVPPPAESERKGASLSEKPVPAGGMSPAALLEETRAFLRRFVVIDGDQLVALSLWTAHTHTFEAFYCTPYGAISSPEKRSGKTRLLEVLELLVRQPLPTANISDAALFRVIDDRAPTLLIDEVDAIFGKKSPRDELRGIVNAGYRRGATTHRMGGANNTTLQTFSVFCPKAFAGIGDSLPDTVADRAIHIRLKRRTRDQSIERFRLGEVEPEGHALRDRLADWLEPQRESLATSRPHLPDELDDRAQDVWEPLLAIADLAGEDWPERARQAALALSGGDAREDDSTTATLIRDISAVFLANNDKALKTADLLEGLHAIEESPWGDWYGKTLSAHGLSRLLKPYRVRTMPV